MSASNLGSYPDNVPAHPEWMSCVYAISGTYGFLPRMLYYATLIFAIFGRRQEWLVIGALVSALTYAGTASIHQMALVGSKSPIFDLDILGAYAVLSTGALAYIGMLHWSSTLRDTRARVIMIVWGFLVGLGLIFARTELFSQFIADPEPACYSRDGKLLEYPMELVSSTFNCTYKCFSVSKPMRQISETMAVPDSLLKSRYMGYPKILLGPIQFVAYAAMSSDSLGRTPSHSCTLAVMKELDPKHHERLVKSIYNTSQESLYGGYILLYQYTRRAPWSWRKVVLYGIALPWYFIELVVDILALPLMVINIVLNEVMIMATQLPVTEANFAIGQWGPWVSSTLVIIAAVINRMLELRQRAKHIKREAHDMAMHGTAEQDLELNVVDSGEGQTTGVVKPKLAHVPTLQDMEMLVEQPKE